MIGKTLAHYKILEKLGRGGMGEVYVAEDTKLSRKVALKVLPPEMAESRERRKRFEREAKAVAASPGRHPTGSIGQEDPTKRPRSQVLGLTRWYDMDFNLHPDVVIHKSFSYGIH